jgi:Ricin-type beta-trefoil lectin domain
MKFTNKINAFAAVFILCGVMTTADDDSEYSPLISAIRSNETWCVTAPSGAKIGAKVGLKLCDNSTRQMWRYHDRKWYSKVNSNRCMAVGTGKSADVKDDAFIRMRDCWAANEFDYDPDVEKDQIQVRSNMAYCMVNQGNNPSSSDLIIVKKCSSSNKFLFRFEGPLDYSGFSNWDGGCLVVKDEETISGQPIILGECELNHNWRNDSAYLFHSELDDGMCMQVVPPSGGSIKKGVQLYLYPCDSSNAKQKFVVNDNDGLKISPKGYETYCAGYKGYNSDVGTDPIVLKFCDEKGVNYYDDNW